MTLKLKQSKDKEYLSEGIRKDGKKYSVRDNRDRFFFPKEWEKFYDALTNDKQRMTFDILLNTGARHNEVYNIKVGDVFLHEKRIILRVTKIKAKKGEKKPRPRTISVSTQFCRRLKKYLKDKDISNKQNEKLGLLSLPAAHICMKNTLRNIKIKDWYMFSVHNVRKTHGNWLKALRIEGAEICTRLGHDYNTFLKSYGSPDIFSREELIKMREILGDLYRR